MGADRGAIMKPSDVRARIQCEQQDLRALLDALGPLIQALETGARDSIGAVLELTRLLCRRLNQKADLEGAILTPVLEEVDAWGAQRAAALRAQHAECQCWLTDLEQALQRNLGCKALARTVRTFTERLARAMDHEDHTLLNGELLRDDVIGIGVEGG
jgi:hypothetical protein